MTSLRSLRTALVVVLAAVATAAAEESTADWLKKILDPAPLGVTPFPGSNLNRKISVDTIRYDRDAPPTKKTAIYLAPIADLEAAAKHFESSLGVPPTGSDTDSKGSKRWLFVLTGAGTAPKAKGLTISILKSPWVDSMVQIQMEYLPPAS